jgi:hypothetical protein
MSQNEREVKLWLNFRVGKDQWPLHLEVASARVNHNSRTMEERDAWQNVPDPVLQLLSGSS